MTTTEYLEISILCSIEVADTIGSIFMGKGCKSVAVDVDINQPASLTGKMIVKSYLDDTPEVFQVIESIQEAIRHFQDQVEIKGYTIETLTVKKESQEDWINKWKEFWKPSKVSEKFVVVPSWETYTPTEEELTIYLDPGIAFGTGSHATTMLCIQELEKYVKPGMNVIDIGCGSGILSIAAAKLQAKSVVGIDIDPFAVQASKENMERNNISSDCTFSATPLQDVTEQFDITVANLISNTIIELMKDILAVTRKEGMVILSGIVKEKEQLIKTILHQHHIQPIFSKVMGDWCIITGRK